MEKAKIEHESNKTEEPLPSFHGKRKNADDEDESGIPSKQWKQVYSDKKPKMRPVVKLRDLSTRKNLYHSLNKKVKLKPEVEVLPANTGGHKKSRRR